MTGRAAAPLGGSAPLIDAHAHFYHAAAGRADWKRVNAARLQAGDRIGITYHVASILGSYGHTSPTYFPSPADVWRADIAVESPAATAAPGSTVAVRARITNLGSGTWHPSSRSGVGHVAVGVQLLDRDGRLLVRDHYRLALPHAVAPGQTVAVTCACPAPSEPGACQFKIDMVAEGVTWFEAAGSTAPVVSLAVR